jgi:hypothetical protein
MIQRLSGIFLSSFLLLFTKGCLYTEEFQLLNLYVLKEACFEPHFNNSLLKETLS